MGYATELRNLRTEITITKKERKENRAAIARGVQEMLVSFRRVRNEFSSARVEDLRHGRAERSESVADLLKSFKNDRREAYAKLTAELRECTGLRCQSVSNMLTSFRTHRCETGSQTQQELARGTAERVKSVQDQLSEFRMVRQSLSEQLGDSLHQEDIERRRKTREFLDTQRNERSEARKAWSGKNEANESAAMSESILQTRSEGDSWGIAPKPVYRETEADVQKKMLAFVNSHPEGVKLSGIEEEFALSRIRAGVLAKDLIDEGKIAKEGLLYVPVREEKE